jgi:hypothetical protein
MRSRLIVLLLLAGVSMIGMVSAMHLVDQGAPEPPRKLFLARVGFQTQLWVDVPLFLVGLTGVLVAAASLLWHVRSQRRAER